MEYDIEFFEKLKTQKRLCYLRGEKLDLTQLVPTISADLKTHYEEYLLAELLEENGYTLFALRLNCVYEVRCDMDPNCTIYDDYLGISGMCRDSVGTVYWFTAVARRELEKEDWERLGESELDSDTYDLDNASIVFTYVNGTIRPPKSDLLQTKGRWLMGHGEYRRYYYDLDSKRWINPKESCPPQCRYCYKDDYVDPAWSDLCAYYGWDPNEGEIADIYE